MSGRGRVDGAAAYVLHSHPYSESSLILEIFAREQGRLALLARGARRPRSALRGVLLAFQPLTLSWFGLGEVKTLAGAEWRGGLPLLSGRCLMLGYYLNELLLRLLPREDAHPRLFDAYGAALAELACGIEAAGLRRFERVLLRELGYGLRLDRTVSEQPVRPAGRYAVLPDRGVVPLADDDDRPAYRGETLLAIEHDDYRDAQTLAEAKKVMRTLISYRLGGEGLKSRQVFIDLMEL